MNLKKTLLFTIYTIGFGLSIFAQDLRLATIQYYTKEHYPFDKSLISDARISKITKTNTVYLKDTIANEFVIAQYEFDRSGNPTYQYHKEIGYSKREIYFRYDSLHRLIRKELFASSPELKYKNIETYEWQYDSLGFLRRERSYRIINTIPNNNGAYGFKERNMLFSNDSIIYHPQDTAVTIVRNDVNNCKDLFYGTGSIPYYPPNFRSVIHTKLKFYPNKDCYSEISKSGSVIIQTKILDKGGNPYPQEKPAKLLWLETILSKRIDCIAADKLKILNRTDTLTKDGRLLLVEKFGSNDRQERSGDSLFTPAESFNYYNLDLQIIYSQSLSYSAYRASESAVFDYVGSNIIDSKAQNDTTGGRALESSVLFRKKNYEYFENGLLKQITTRDENDNIVEIISYKISHFD